MIHPRAIAASAALLALGAAILGFVLVSPAFGLGVAAGGALASADFWWLGRRVRALVASPGRASALALGLLSSLHLVLLAGAAWLLLRAFPPVALLVGFSCVVAALVLRAAADLLQDALHPATR